MRHILLLLLLLTASSAYAQTPEREVLPDVPDINGMAVSLVQPAFPETAVAVDADGRTVSLRVVVDENGNAVSATCSLTCHSMLKDAAELAAMTSKFKPLIKDGRPVRYQGILLYTFVVKRVDWFRFATAIESTRQFDNISFGPVAQILPVDFAKERMSLMALDANGGADYDTRQKVIGEVVGTVRSKLKGSDLWWFDLGLALRRVTFWSQAGGPVDRAELQTAIDGLSPVIASAPEGVSADLIKELTVISRYRVIPDMPERDLRRALADFSKNTIRHFLFK